MGRHPARRAGRSISPLGGPMRHAPRFLPLVLGALLLALAAPTAPAVAAAAPPAWELPVAVKKLPNGLTVVVSEDHSSPTFGLSVIYGVGFRLEPRGRTGFAHLFEHMMFQGT